MRAEIDDLVAVVIPVKNEEKAIRKLLHSFESLSVKPQEVIIVDGGSTDNTPQEIKNYIEQSRVPYNIRLIEIKEGAFPGKGRNVGIRNSKCEIIACIDAGAMAKQDWLEKSISPFKKDDSIEVVIGSCESNAHTLFEKCAFFMFKKELYEKNLIYAGAYSITFRKSLWERIGGYPENVYPNEDKCFLTKIKSQGAKVYFEPKAAVLWSPRQNIWQFAKQYFSYGRADARYNFVPAQHILRISVYMLGMALVILGFKDYILWLILIIGLISYLMRTTLKALRKIGSRLVFLYIPMILLTKDLVQIGGYILGTMERFMNPRFQHLAKEALKR